MKPCRFSKFEKIAEYATEFGAVKRNVFRRLIWICTEKVHGANFSFFIDDSLSIKYAKRTGFLSQEDDFFGYRRYLPHKYDEKVIHAYNATRERLSVTGPMSLCICGELFGGGYPHPDVPACDDAQLVQSGIYYAPDLAFYAFDMWVETAEKVRTYLDYDMAMSILDACGFLYAAPLCRGTYEECIEYPLGFESTIPARLGLPPLPGNRAEGVVVKSIAPLFVDDQGRPYESCGSGKLKRVILKRKIAEFSERQYDDNRFERRKPQQGEPTASTLELLTYEMQACVNEVRVAAVLSKIGRVDPKSREAMRGALEAFMRDVLDDLVAQDGVGASALGPSDRHEFEALLREESKRALVAYLRKQGDLSRPN